MMTTKFNAPDWRGRTVAIFAGGPSMSIALAESLRAHVTIAVNHVVTLVPWVDALVALDGDVAFWNGVRGYAGMKMCGVPSDDADAMFIGSMYERVEVSPQHAVDIRNSGLAAIRIASRCGASRIILAGFDPEAHGHMDGYAENAQLPGPEPYPHLTAGLSTVIAQVRAAGVTVEFATLPPPTATIKKRSTVA